MHRHCPASRLPPRRRLAGGDIHGDSRVSHHCPGLAQGVSLAVAAPLHQSVASADSGFLASALARAARDDYSAWLAQAAAVGGCSRPVRLRGHVHHIDPATGEVLRTIDTANAPDGVIYTACGDRRASVCPACAETYRADTYQLIRTGLVGGKGVPDSVAAYPCVFATFTAPSFGPVHARITSPGGQVLRCRPATSTPGARTAGPCPAPVATATPTPAWASRCARTATTTKAPWCGTRMRPNCGGVPPSPCTAAWTSSPATTA